eukprot:COSAG02_NODE_7052_length_3208_cov_1.044709_2_plen_74_part_00
MSAPSPLQSHSISHSVPMKLPEQAVGGFPQSTIGPKSDRLETNVELFASHEPGGPLRWRTHLMSSRAPQDRLF